MVLAQSSRSMVNFSTRGALGLGTNRLISGFVIEGTGTKNVLVRGVGPGLIAFGVPNPAVKTKIQLFDAAGQIVAENDGFQTAATIDQMSEAAATINALAKTAAKVGAFPLTSPGDSALLASLPPGAYSVVVMPGVNATATGNAMLEVYDADAPGTATCVMTNVSSRGMVGAGAGALIMGFVLAGDAPRQLLFRGTGRDLAAYNIVNPANTVGVRAYNATGLMVAASDIVSPAIFGGGIGSSAAFATLPAGAYLLTVAPSSTNTADGVGLIEVYDLGAAAAAQK